MWILGTVAMVVSSETARSLLQDAFAWGSVVVHEHLWTLLAATVVLAIVLRTLAGVIQRALYRPVRPTPSPELVCAHLPSLSSPLLILPSPV